MKKCNPDITNINTQNLPIFIFSGSEDPEIIYFLINTIFSAPLFTTSLK
jgi:hypothetical protein